MPVVETFPIGAADWEGAGARVRYGRATLDVKRARYAVRALPKQWRERELSKLMRDWMPIQGDTPAQAYSRARCAWVSMERNVQSVADYAVRPTEGAGFWRGVHAATSDDSIADMARRASRYCRNECEFNRAYAGERVRAFLKGWGLGEAEGVPQDTCPMMARACDTRWWRRKLRVLRNRCTERAAMAVGYLGNAREKYCSSVNVKGFARRDLMTRKMMRETRLISDDGEITLFDAWQSSVSNPVNRLSEVVTRIKGHEKCGKARGDVCLFVTMTCPSRYHAKLATGEVNQRWDGSTPRAAQGHLRATWANVRRRLNEQGVFMHGMRIAEPHHDGCAHWHMALWCKAHHESDVREVMRREALRVDGDEPGAASHRITFERIEESRGDVIAYMLKYLLKNLPVDDQETSVLTENREENKNQSQNPLELTNELEKSRASVWSRIWGIRQFQFFGSAPVTLWRVLRRMAISSFGGAMREVVEQCHRVGDRLADYSVFMREAVACRGAFGVPVAGFEAVRAHSDAVNCYGEAVSQKTIGVADLIGKVYHYFPKRYQVRRRGAVFLGPVSITVRGREQITVELALPDDPKPHSRSKSPWQTLPVTTQLTC